MEQKEINIIAPEGYEIDWDNSTFKKIVFKKSSQIRWRDDISKAVKGFYINSFSDIIAASDISVNIYENYNIFAIEKQAKAALAMARISQIIANDKRFGGPVTDEEWETTITKFIIYRFDNKIACNSIKCEYYFLAFHIEGQRDLFLEENEDLVKDYLMLS